jgi:hypothetical protein
MVVRMEATVEARGGYGSRRWCRRPEMVKRATDVEEGQRWSREEPEMVKSGRLEMERRWRIGEGGRGEGQIGVGVQVRELF